MTKLLVIITCIVVLTVHWDSFRDIINMEKIVDITATVLEKVKE
tara:strand:- start:306 stop:437 length:132 start_codon:yes stop_codon:yes gene_type:complete